MINYKEIVEGEKVAREKALAVLDESEPLDAQDEDRRMELCAALSALECVLRAFEEAESEAIDEMAKSYGEG